jgi:hypothetical protein
MNMTHYDFTTPKLRNLGNPSDGKFNYPPDKRRTQENVQAMVAAESALDAFWTAANAQWRKLVRTTPEAVVKHIIGDWSLHRTLPWKEPLDTSTVVLGRR